MKGKWETTGIELILKLGLLSSALCYLASTFPYERVFKVMEV